MAKGEKMQLSDKGQAAKIRAKMKWISVEDRMPNKETRLLYYQGGIYVSFGYTLYNSTILHCNGFPVDGITHWMPMPNPPTPV